MVSELHFTSKWTTIETKTHLILSLLVFQKRLNEFQWEAKKPCLHDRETAGENPLSKLSAHTVIILLCAHFVYTTIETTKYTLKAASVTQLLIEASIRCVTAECY